MRVPTYSWCVFILCLLGPGRAFAAQEPPQTIVSSAGAAVQPQPALAPARRPARSVLTELGRDVSRLPSKETAIALAIGGALALAAHPADQALNTRMQSAGLRRVLGAGDLIGIGWMQAGGALGTFAIGHALAKPRVSSLGGDLLRAQAITGALTQGLKAGVGRTRPDGGRYSFPSGHASASFTTATVLQQHLGWRVGVPAYAAASYVAVSRLSDNRHYVSDVIFGAAVGIASGRLVTVSDRRSRFAVTPVVVRGGAGVLFVRVATP